LFGLYLLNSSKINFKIHFQLPSVPSLKLLDHELNFRQLSVKVLIF